MSLRGETEQWIISFQRKEGEGRLIHSNQKKKKRNQTSLTLFTASSQKRKKKRPFLVLSRGETVKLPLLRSKRGKKEVDAV